MVTLKEHMMSYTRTYRRNTINQMKDKSKWTHFLVSRTFHFSVCRTVDSRNYDRDFFAFFSTLFWPNLFAAKTVSSANNGWRIRLGCGRWGGCRVQTWWKGGCEGCLTGALRALHCSCVALCCVCWWGPSNVLICPMKIFAHDLQLQM